jgi:hypothetical protein
LNETKELDLCDTGLKGNALRGQHTVRKDAVVREVLLYDGRDVINEGTEVLIECGAPVSGTKVTKELVDEGGMAKMMEEYLVDVLEDGEEEGDRNPGLGLQDAVPQEPETAPSSVTTLLGITIPGLLDEGVNGSLTNKDMIETMSGDVLHVIGKEGEDLENTGNMSEGQKEEGEGCTPPKGPSMRS